MFDLPATYNGSLIRVKGYDYSYHLDRVPTSGETGIFKFGEYYGSEAELINYAQQMLKFDWTMESPEPQDWGGIDLVSGNWTGTLGLLVKDEADVTFGCAFR